MLDKKLMEYAKTDTYPFHMPGHKRQLGFSNPYSIDITEIGGFDNLHHPEGILREAQARAGELYGARKSYYLVNGSTCGLLAAICAAAGKCDKVLVARNCHKSVYHAIFLQEMSPVYLFPEQTRYGIQGQIRTEQLEDMLREHADIRAVILTSPTYEGIISDIAGIAEIVHNHGIPLIVDGAHGAHLGFSEAFPKSAVGLGADAVVVSLHKTLPSFTQTALLHLCSDRIPAGKVEEYLDIFETSSPSYILMAGMERCIRMVSDKKNELFAALAHNLAEFYKKTRNLRYLHVLHKEDLTVQEAFDFDESKISIFTGDAGIDGRSLQEILREKYQLELEMACSDYVLALATVMDTAEGFRRLADALLELDEEFSENTVCSCAKARQGIGQQSDRTVYGPAGIMPVKEMEIHEAKKYPVKEMNLSESAGQICADFILPYPPGIPLIVPGERISGQLIGYITHCREIGLDVEGITSKDRINVVKTE